MSDSDNKHTRAVVGIALICCVSAVVMLMLLIFFAPDELAEVAPWALVSMAALALGLGGVCRPRSCGPGDDQRRPN